MIQRVFAYGSNMHLPDLRSWMRRTGHHEARVVDARPAILSDWELVWNYRSPVRRGGAANVQQKPGAVLPGVLLEVDQPALVAIDQKEGHPERYDRGTTRVHVEGEAHDAWLYVVTADYRHPGVVPPRAEYLRLVVEGAIAHGLPRWHVEALRRVATID